MQKDAPQNDAPAPAEERPDEVLKKTPVPTIAGENPPPKGGKDVKEARLAAALRENLRRRKAAARKETD